METKTETNHEAIEALQPGDAVVFQHEDGGSSSAVLVRREHHTLHLRLAVPYQGRSRLVVGWADWFRVVPFTKGALFMVVEETPYGFKA